MVLKHNRRLIHEKNNHTGDGHVVDADCPFTIFLHALDCRSTGRQHFRDLVQATDTITRVSRVCLCNDSHHGQGGRVHQRAQCIYRHLDARQDGQRQSSGEHQHGGDQVSATRHQHNSHLVFAHFSTHQPATDSVLALRKDEERGEESLLLG